MSGPRVALREAYERGHQVDLLFYDDVLAIVPVGWYGGDVFSWLVAAPLLLVFGPRLDRRRERREASPETLPWGTRRIRLADVEAVRVERRPYSGAWLVIDGREFRVGDAVRYRPPWTDLLGPVFGDRLTVV